MHFFLAAEYSPSLECFPHLLPPFSWASAEFSCRISHTLFQSLHISCSKLWTPWRQELCFPLNPRALNTGSQNRLESLTESLCIYYLGRSGRIFMCRQKIKIMGSEHITLSSPFIRDEEAKAWRGGLHALEMRSWLVFSLTQPPSDVSLTPAPGLLWF